MSQLSSRSWRHVRSWCRLALVLVLLGATPARADETHSIVKGAVRALLPGGLLLPSPSERFWSLGGLSGALLLAERLEFEAGALAVSGAGDNGKEIFLRAGARVRLADTRRERERGWVLAIPAHFGYSLVLADKSCEETDCSASRHHSLLVDTGFEATYWLGHLGLDMRLLGEVGMRVAKEHSRGLALASGYALAIGLMF